VKLKRRAMSEEQALLPLSDRRRIDITIERLDQMAQALPPDQQKCLAGTAWNWWSIVVMVARLRAMERAEIEAGCKSSETMADAYDLVVAPGEHAVGAMFKTFRAVSGSFFWMCRRTGASNV